jgi:AsmA protein
MKGLLPDFSLKTKDPAVLTAMSTRMKIKGTTRNIEISDGTIELDQSKMTFSAIARDFKKPDLAFKMNLDRLDVDRYLPPAEEKKAEGKPEKQTKTGYGPLRKMVLDGAINIGELDIKGSHIKDIQLRLKGQNGILNLEHFSLKTYEGNMTGDAVLDFRGDVPVTQAKLEVKEVQVRRLISDFMKKDILEGKATASINLSMSGDNAALIKKSMDGKGEIQFRDGAIVGIDLSGMVNNLKAAFGLAQPGESKDRTDFSEFIIPFEINDGVVNTQKTTLVSPVLRILAKGNADLSKETLDFRVEPTFVATLKGQGDTKERSGVTVPVLVTGSFTDPKFSPDLTGMLKKGIEKGVEKLIKGRTEGDAIKGLLKSILGE